MKSLKRVTATSDIKNTFTAEEVVELLSSIEELKGCKISFKESADGTVMFTVGSNVYETTV